MCETVKFPHTVFNLLFCFFCISIDKCLDNNKRVGRWTEVVVPPFKLGVKHIVDHPGVRGVQGQSFIVFEYLRTAAGPGEELQRHSSTGDNKVRELYRGQQGQRAPLQGGTN